MKPLYMPRSKDQMYGRSYRRDRKAKQKAAVSARLAKVTEKNERVPADETFLTDEECKRAAILFPGDEGAPRRIAWLQAQHSARVMAALDAERRAKGFWGNRNSWSEVLVTTATMHALYLLPTALFFYMTATPEVFHFLAIICGSWFATRIALALLSRQAV